VTNGDPQKMAEMIYKVGHEQEMFA